MAQAVYPISEAAKRAGVSVHQIRIYVQLGLVASCKTTGGGHGQYNQSCVERLRLIHAAVQSGLLLGELKDFFQALDKRNHRALQQQQATLIARLAARRQTLQTCQALLSRLVDRSRVKYPLEEAP